MSRVGSDDPSQLGEAFAGLRLLISFLWIGTDAHALARHDQKSIELRGVVSEDVREPLDLDSQLRILAKTKMQHPEVGLPSGEDQLSEVAVIGNQDALLAVSDR